MTNAEIRYLARIEADLRTLIGPGVELELRREDAKRGVRLVARLRLGNTADA